MLLEDILEKRKKENRLRQLSVNSLPVDFSSNDYLGFASSSILKQSIQEALELYPGYKNGSTGSRLLTGNTDYAEQLEGDIAAYHGSEAALLFNSGYDANIGIFSCIATRNDTILYDELCHASIIDGIRLSFASSYKFPHNDLVGLEDKLKKSKGNIYVAVESVYSMDGDSPSLKDLVLLCDQYHAKLIVDEAHATGVFGEQGKGLGYEYRDHLFARIITFGKALGVHGAAVAGSVVLKNFLINYARSFIYSTALPFHSLVAIRCAYELMEKAELERKKLHELIAHFTSKRKQKQGWEFLESISPIQGIIIPGNEKVKQKVMGMREKGFDVRAVLSPTVAAGKERIRLCLHSFNIPEEIDQLLL